MKDFLESRSLLWSVWWCFSFFLPVVKNNGEDKFIGLSPPAEGFQVGLRVPMQGGREVLEARLLEAWDSHGRGALSGVTYSSMLTVSGLAVWRSVLSVIFLYQPLSSHWKQWLLAVPRQCATVQVTNMQSNLRTCSFSLLWSSSSLPLNGVFYMFVISEMNWILRSYTGFIFKAKPKCPESCEGQAFT